MLSYKVQRNIKPEEGAILMKVKLGEQRELHLLL